MIKDNDNGNDAVFINDIVRSYYIDRWEGCCLQHNKGGALGKITAGTKISLTLRKPRINVRACSILFYNKLFLSYLHKVNLT